MYSSYHSDPTPNCASGVKRRIKAKHRVKGTTVEYSVKPSGE